SLLQHGRPVHVSFSNSRASRPCHHFFHCHLLADNPTYVAPAPASPSPTAPPAPLSLTESRNTSYTASPTCIRAVASSRTRSRYSQTAAPDSESRPPTTSPSPYLPSCPCRTSKSAALFWEYPCTADRI